MNDDLAVIELTIEQARHKINKMKAFERLCKNGDFQDIILEDFFEQEAIRLVMCKSMPNMQTDEEQRELDKRIYSIGSLHQYFNTIKTYGRMAERSLHEDELTRDELMAEA